VDEKANKTWLAGMGRCNFWKLCVALMQHVLHVVGGIPKVGEMAVSKIYVAVMTSGYACTWKLPA